MSKNALMILSSDGKCQLYQHEPAASGTMKVSLVNSAPDDQADSAIVQLLAEGWTPTRETGFGNGSVLIVWSKP